MGSFSGTALSGFLAALGGVEFESSWSPGWVLAAGLILLGVVASLYALDLRSRSVRRHQVLLFLRLAAVAILVLLLLEPVRYRRISPSIKPTVAVLLDTSASMGIEEETGRTTTTRLAQALSVLRGTPSGLLLELQKRFETRVFTFESDTSEVTNQLPRILRELKSEGSSTNLGQAMREVVDRLAPESLAAQIILTDGAWNAGPEPVQVAHQMGARSIQVFPVALGSAQERVEVAIESVLADEVVLPGDRARVEVVIRGEGLVNESLDLRILKATDHVTGSSPTVRADGLARTTLTFDLPPDTPPNLPVTYSVWVPPRENEISEDNNREDFQVKLVKRPLKVILMDELPRWEFRYLKNALLRDPGIELDCVLLDFRGVPVRGEVYRDWFPDRAEALAEYDVVILGDIGPGRFSPMQLEATRGFVDEEGGGVIFQAGTRSAPHAFLGTPLEELLPVTPGSPSFSADPQSPFPFSLTVEGRLHPALTILQDVGDKVPAWQDLPGFRWFAPVESTKPAATVLATHPFLESDMGKTPLLATMHYGRGRAVYIGVDATWRWRFGGGDEIHHRFWGRLIRWLAENRFHGGSPLVRLQLDRRRCYPNEAVRIHARILDRNRFPLENADVQIEYESSEREKGEIPLSPDPDRRGHYQGEFTPRESGEYLLRPRIPSLVGEDFGIEASLSVASRSLELADLQPDHDLLARIAAASGGRLHPVEDASRIAREITFERSPSSLEAKTNLWDSPYVIILIAAILGVEWWLRKRRGLA
jgi:uncharacterized membrane protein